MTRLLFALAFSVAVALPAEAGVILSNPVRSVSATLPTADPASNGITDTGLGPSNLSVFSTDDDGNFLNPTLFSTALDPVSPSSFSVIGTALGFPADEFFPEGTDVSAQFQVTFALSVPTKIDLLGQVAADGNGWQSMVSLTRVSPSSSSLLSVTGNSGITPFSLSGLLQPGTYTLLGKANGPSGSEIEGGNSSFNISRFQLVPTPEPASMTLFSVMGLTGLWLNRRRKMKV